MRNYFLPIKEYYKMAIKSIAGSDGRRFLILSTLVSVTVPMTTLYAYDLFSPSYQNIAEPNDHERSVSSKESVLDAAPSVTGQATINAQTDSKGIDTKTQLEVNNQSINVPDNSSFSKTITDNNGTTSIDVLVNAESTESSYIYSSTDIQVSTTSESEVSNGPGFE